MHKLIWSSGDLIFVLAVATVFITVTLTWWRFRNTAYPQMSGWRRLACQFGLAGNTISLALLLVFLALSFFQIEAIVRHPSLQIVFSFLLWTVFSLLTALGGAFGRGAARVLVITNGVLLTALWYLLGLANSP
jgi:hypothetical protein